MDNTIPSRLCSAIEKNNDRIAFNYFDGEWKSMTYGEFFSLSKNIASFLMKKGFHKGDRAAVVSENRPEWCASYMAIVMAGGIAVPIDMQLGRDEIRNLLVDSESKIIFYSAKTEENVFNAIEVLNLEAINFDVVSFSHTSIDPFTLSQISPDDIASIIYTSGTTGNPKGVMLTHKNFCSDADAVIQVRVITHDDNVLSILPLHHTYPFMCTFLVPIFLGAAVTFSPALKAAEMMSAIKDKGATIVVAVPRLLELIRTGIVSRFRDKGKIFLWLMNLCGIIRTITGINIGKIIFEQVHENFPMLRFFASGGARLEPEIMQDLEAIGFTVLEGYGLTETAPVIAFNPIQRRKPGSVGIPLPSVEIQISDDGEIAAKGPMIMKGYYKNQAATEAVIRDGWFFTGDTGYMDDEGYLFITGRKKEVIVLASGKNVYPQDVESFYSSIPLIKEICIVERHGQLHAIIVPDIAFAKREQIGNIYEALKWKINEASMRIPEYMRIKGFTLYNAPLPRTPLGKLRRFMINEMLNAKGKGANAKEADISLMKDEMGRKVADCISALMDEPVPIAATDNLELDLGFDSLKRIELASALEAAFSISLPEKFTSEIQTVEDVVSRLREYSAECSAGQDRTIDWKYILSKAPLAEDAAKSVFSYLRFELVATNVFLFFMKMAFRLFFRLEVRGLENMPAGSAFIIAPNHASFLDGFIIASSIPLEIFEDLYFLGFQKYFTGMLKSWFARISHVIPIDTETYLNRALQMSAYVLKNKKALCVFPEGGRSFDGRLMEFKKGIGILAAELNIPVVPAYIKGAFRALPRGAWLVKPTKIEVIFGEAIRFSDIDMKRKPAGMDEYQFFADKLRERVQALSENI